MANKYLLRIPSCINIARAITIPNKFVKRCMPSMWIKAFVKNLWGWLSIIPDQDIHWFLLITPRRSDEIQTIIKVPAVARYWKSIGLMSLFLDDLMKLPFFRIDRVAHPILNEPHLLQTRRPPNWRSANIWVLPQSLHWCCTALGSIFFNYNGNNLSKQPPLATELHLG